MNFKFTPSFLRQLKKQPVILQKKVLKKIKIFKENSSNKSLKIHKLHGSLKGSWSFSVDYKTRIIFEWTSKNDIALLAIGNHDVYKI